MPLIKSSSKKAFKKNVETEMDANPGKANRSQNLAIAYNVQRKNKKKMATGGKVPGVPGAEDDREPAQPMAKPDNRRLEKDDYMSDDWAGGPDPIRKPDDERRPKDAYLDTNDWSDDEAPSRKPFAKGGEVLTEKPNAPRPSQESTESTALNSKAPRQGSTAAQMAEYHEQEAAKYRMYADGGVIPPEGMAQEDGYPGTPPRVEDDYRRPKDAYIDTPDWSDDEAPSRKPFAEGGKTDPNDSIADAVYKKNKRKRMAEGGVADVDENAREFPNEEDDMSYEALKKENYSEEAGLDALDQPMDSNEHGNELSDEDTHDMIDQIRKKIKYKQMG